MIESAPIVSRLWSGGGALILAVILFLAAGGLGGCAVTGGGGAQPGVSLTQANYNAADMLSQQTQAVMSRDNLLRIGMIEDIAHPAAETPFGKTVASHIAARFVQLGYPVSAASYGEMSGGAPLPDYRPDFKPDYQAGGAYGSAYGAAPAARNVLLTGQYAVAKKDILVNLRLLDAGSNRVIAAYDYSLPMSRDLKKLVAVPGAKKNWFGF